MPEITRAVKITMLGACALSIYIIGLDVTRYVKEINDICLSIIGCK